MSHQIHSIEIVKQIIIAHHKLFVEVYLTDSPEIQAILHQMIHAKLHHKSINLYQYLLEAFLLSGGGDQSNQGYYAKQSHKPTFNRVKQVLKAAQCPKLAGFETFKGCGYRKTIKKCNEPAFLRSCPLPTFDMKRGNLNQMAFSLYFFLRDVCRRDFYTYTTQHFGMGQVSDGAINDRLQGFIKKVSTIANVGPKLAHMALSCLFLTAYPGWNYRRVGAHMIAVDSLVHNFLHRTGILDSYQMDHAYGPRCHAQNGCLGVIQDLAGRIDCRQFNPSLPAHFPRFVQYYIWAYCGQSGENICNLNKCKPGKRTRTASSTSSGCAPGCRSKGELSRLGTHSSSHEPYLSISDRKKGRWTANAEIRDSSPNEFVGKLITHPVQESSEISIPGINY